MYITPYCQTKMKRKLDTSNTGNTEKLKYKLYFIFDLINLTMPITKNHNFEVQLTIVFLQFMYFLLKLRTFFCFAKF